MATVLYRLGSWTFDHRRTVVAIWVSVLVALGVLAAAFGGHVSNSFTVPGTESQRALTLLGKEFPGTGGATARIGFADLQFSVPVDKVSGATKAALAKVAAPARRAGLEVEYSGGVLTTHSS